MELKVYKLLQVLSDDNGVIIMDTASLMEDSRLSYMVELYRPLLIKNRQSIIIPGVVCQELVRHLTSENEEKKRKANEALKIIRNNGDIFTVESAEYTSDEIRKAFADREILLRLTNIRATRRQLLITNDRKLSRDAYNLNQIESCRGKEVFVYYLANNGNLCECEHPAIFQQCEVQQPTRIIVEKVPVYIESEKDIQPSVGEIFGLVLAAASIFGVGYGTCKYGKIAVSSIKEITRRYVR